MANKDPLPKYNDLFAPTLAALKALGGSGAIEEINDAVTLAIGASEAQLEATYPKSGGLILPDRMSWARSYLRAAGLIDRPTRGVWILTEPGRAAADKHNADLKRLVVQASRAATVARKIERAETDTPEDEAEQATPDWNDLLLQHVQTIPPAAFERLCQRLLRESGFTRVEVTGKTGDGGIDGAGVLRMNLISFQVLFQCKRYKGSVGTETVRNFRGAMQGRADKGLIITTGTFTTEARREATRDGAPAIDLIDGEALCLLLKDLRLGIRVVERKIEEIVIEEAFFAAL